MGSFGWLTATFTPRGSKGFLVGRLAATERVTKLGSFGVFSYFEVLDFLVFGEILRFLPI